MLTMVTARTNRKTIMIFLFLRDVGALELEEKVRLVLGDEAFTGIGGSCLSYYKIKESESLLSLTNCQNELANMAVCSSWEFGPNVHTFN